MEIWFVGLTTLDVVHYGRAPATRNAKVSAEAQVVCAGGPAANAAVVAARLGASDGVRVRLITALGNSPPASIAAADVEEQGVQIFDLSDDGFQFPVSSVLVDSGTGERSVVSLGGGGWAGPEFIEPAALAKLETPPQAVMFDGHHPGVARAVASRLGSDTLVVLDCGRWRPLFDELLPLADVAACSKDFAPPPGTAMPPAVVVTDGANPVRWTVSDADGAATGEVPVPSARAIDTLGAGDAWHGAFTYYIATGATLIPAITAANQVAALRVQHQGNRAWLSNICANCLCHRAGRPGCVPPSCLSLSGA